MEPEQKLSLTSTAGGARPMAAHNEAACAGGEARSTEQGTQNESTSTQQGSVRTCKRSVTGMDEMVERRVRRRPLVATRRPQPYLSKPLSAVCAGRSWPCVAQVHHEASYYRRRKIRDEVSKQHRTILECQ